MDDAKTIEAMRAALEALRSEARTTRAIAAAELSVMLRHDTRRVFELALSEGLFGDLTDALEHLPRAR